MTINLPNELASSLRTEVLNGRFATEDDAVTEILRDYFRRKDSERATKPGVSNGHGELGSIGAMRDDADLLDRAVEYAMQVRENRPWRLGNGE